MQIAKATDRPLLRWLGLSMLVSLAVTVLAATPALAHAYFEVTTEGEPPENATFWGMYGPPNSEFSAVQLTDPDGDGVYAGGVTLEPDNYVTQIVQGTGVQDTVYGPFPGEPSNVLRDFGTIWLDNDTVLRASVSFDGEQPDEEQPQCLLPEGCPGTSDPDEVFTGTEDSEVLFGTNNNDLIEGLGGHDYLNGLWGDDEILGGQGHDLLVGEAGSDRVEGGEGNDYLVAAYGYWQQAPDAPARSDLLRGGPGHDVIDAADLAGAPDTVECGPGYDVVYAGVEDNVADNCEVVYRYAGF